MFACCEGFLGNGVRSWLHTWMKPGLCSRVHLFGPFFFFYGLTNRHRLRSLTVPLVLTEYVPWNRTSKGQHKEGATSSNSSKNDPQVRLYPSFLLPFQSAILTPRGNSQLVHLTDMSATCTDSNPSPVSHANFTSKRQHTNPLKVKGLPQGSLDKESAYH